MRKLLELLKEKFILVYIFILAGLIVVSAVVSYYNKQQLVNTAQTKKQAEQVKYLLGGIFERTLRSVDLGIRGFALTNNPQLLSPYEGAVREHESNLRKIDSLLTLQKLDTSVEQFVKVKAQINNYLQVADQMLKDLQAGDKDGFLTLLSQDKGYDAWVAFAPFYQNVSRYEDALITQADTDYENAMNRNLILQGVLLVVGVGILFLIASRIQREEKIRAGIFQTLSQNSDTYLFNAGRKHEQLDQSSVINETIGHFKKASEFISAVANGNYKVQWEGLDKSNEALNQQTLAGLLHSMKDKLVRIREEEEKRNWNNQGLAQYSEVVRKFQNDLDQLCLESVQYIVRYIKAQQGWLFVVASDNDGKYLRLASCFAFDRRKFLQKRVEIGNGLVGQVYLEGNTVRMTQIPKDYAAITSGLGHSRPNCLVIVPMKHNDEVVAVLELAALHEVHPDQVQFIERCGEFLAAALSNAETNNQIKALLQESQMQAETMKSQEEEMRQNLEELSATQEEMLRKEREYIERIATLEKEVANMHTA